MKNLKLTMMKIAVKIPILLFTLFLALSCSKRSCLNSKNGELKNYTGLDGCGWVIVLEDGTKLEPTNLSEFNIALEEAKKISVSYKSSNNMASICMVGELVEIDCIKER
jgi:hypothetical protein